MKRFLFNLFFFQHLGPSSIFGSFQYDLILFEIDLRRVGDYNFINLQFDFAIYELFVFNQLNINGGSFQITVLNLW